MKSSFIPARLSPLLCPVPPVAAIDIQHSPTRGDYLLEERDDGIGTPVDRDAKVGPVSPQADLPERLFESSDKPVFTVKGCPLRPNQWQCEEVAVVARQTRQQAGP